MHFGCRCIPRPCPGFSLYRTMLGLAGQVVNECGSRPDFTLANAGRIVPLLAQIGGEAVGVSGKL